MTAEEFRGIVEADGNPSGPVHRAARAGKPPEQFGPITEVAVVALMFPIVRYVLSEIGLPWLHELRRWSELWRQKFHRWIDEQHRKEGFDPDAAEAAGEALREELQRTTDSAARQAWERLREMMKKD
jgi:hypothetical protein